MEEISNTIKEKVRKLENPSDIWSLHDYLSSQRKNVDRKYDYRYSQLLYIFPTLISQNYISESDLLGLSEEKMVIIQRLQN
jgi:Photoprotection regulator fluorescence recovery protein